LTLSFGVFRERNLSGNHQRIVAYHGGSDSYVVDNELQAVSSRGAAPLSAAEECALKPEDSFRDCANSPELVPFLRDG